MLTDGTNSGNFVFENKHARNFGNWMFQDSEFYDLGKLVASSDRPLLSSVRSHSSGAPTTTWAASPSARTAACA